MQIPQQNHQLFINNRMVSSINGDTLPVINPSTGAAVGTIARGLGADLDKAVSAARQAFETHWGRKDAVERSRLMMRWSQLVLIHQEELAQLECLDTGKPLKQGRADAQALARYFEFYAGAADKLHGQTLPYQNGYTVLTLRQAHGVTGHIIPWNYPMQIFGRSVGASLAVGNAVVVKPAEDACISLLRVAELAAEAGFPEGALNIVTGLGNEAGQALTEHSGIDHISFTGSTSTGTKVALAAAQHRCPVTMELGGKSPQLVFADADLDAALPVLVNAIIQNAGQTCSAGSRVLIEQSIFDELMGRLVSRFSDLIAAPSQQDRDLGPLVSRVQQQRVWDYLSDAHAAGLEFAAEGTIVDDAPESGFYQAPVLLSNVPSSNKLFQEEIFGPVLVTTPFRDEAHALELANATQYGLVAGIWTNNGARQMRMAKAIRSGQVFINNYGAGGGVELPFGGVGQSGYGREKGFEALYGFTNLKTIAIKHD
jgi:aldehyde dehydrogenase (NAD+)